MTGHLSQFCSHTQFEPLRQKFFMVLDLGRISLLPLSPIDAAGWPSCSLACSEVGAQASGMAKLKATPGGGALLPGAWGATSGFAPQPPLQVLLPGCPTNLGSHPKGKMGCPQGISGLCHHGHRAPPGLPSTPASSSLGWPAKAGPNGPMANVALAIDRDPNGNVFASLWEYW